MLSEYYKTWIKYAKNDIDIATREMNLDINPRHRAYEAILYHSQQAAEKMLKAYLVHKGENPWGHDLDSLRTSCAKFDSSFNGIRITGHCVFNFICCRTLSGF